MRQRLLSLFRNYTASPEPAPSHSSGSTTSLDEIASASACCSITSLDELANAGNASSSSSMSQSMVMNPTATTQMAAMTGVVSYLGIAGVLVGKKIYDDFSVKENRLVRETGTLAKRLDTVNLPEEKRVAYQAYQLHVTEQLRRVRFQKLWAGVVSPIGSGGVVVGQAITPISPTSLFILSLTGAAHAADMVAVYQQVNKQIKRAKTSANAHSDKDSLAFQESTLRLRHFEKERWHVVRNTASWIGYTIGTATIGITQTLSMASSIMVPAALTVTGVTALAGGIAGTLVHNNIITNRFITSMPEYASAAMASETPLSHDDVRKQNIAANERRLAVKEYRQQFWDARSVYENMEHGWLRFRQKFLAYSTVGLVDRFAAQLKFEDKIRVTKKASPQMDERRLEMLTELQKLEESCLGTKPAEHCIVEPFVAETESALGKLLEGILKSHHHGGIAKMLSRRIMAEVKTPHTREEKVQVKGWFVKSKEKTVHKPIFELRVRQEYADLFAFRQEGEEEKDKKGATRAFDNIETLGILRHYGPCCNGDYEGSELLENIQRFYCHDNPKGQSVASAEQKQRMTSLLKEVTDQYLLFQLRKDSKERIAVWSNISDGYDKVKAEEKEKAAVALQEKLTELSEKKVTSSVPARSFASSVSPHRSTSQYPPYKVGSAAPAESTLPTADSQLITKEEGTIIAKTLLEKEPLPEEYTSFNEIMRTTLKDGSLHIVYQDPFDASTNKHIHYLIDRAGQLTVQHGSAASAIIPINKQSGNKVTGIEIHTICNGVYEGGWAKQPTARHGTGESSLHSVSQIQKNATVPRDLPHWQKHVLHTSGARGSSLMVH